MGCRPGGVAAIAAHGELILIDSSAWVEFLRGTGSSVNTQVRTLLEGTAMLATTEPIVMEVLAGARDDGHLKMLRRLVLGCQMIPLRGLSDYEEAAATYRTCRRAGLTVRRLVDCLIATVAINAGVPLLHADSDFDLIARRTALQIATTVG
ncbi:PIN domain nuclease [Candidatus Dormiibacter inghamiae]|uniref:type II toxin-antitoxin system VapC family toxin n=1 Tax=Candidatus Dormiibacter inghamiae TaxID=3127013 RepID=UPI0030C727CB